MCDLRPYVDSLEVMCCPHTAEWWLSYIDLECRDVERQGGKSLSGDEKDVVFKMLYDDGFVIDDRVMRRW